MGIPLESVKSSSKKNIGEPRLPNTAQNSSANKSTKSSITGKNSSTTFGEPVLPNLSRHPRSDLSGKSTVNTKSNRRRSVRQSTDSIGHYLSSIGKVPLLTASEEILLAKEVQKMKILLKSVSEKSEVTEELALKSDFNFKEEIHRKDKEKSSEEILGANTCKESFESDLKSSIFYGKAKFSKINSQSKVSFKKLVEYVESYLKDKKEFDKRRQLKRCLKARERMIAANLRLVVSVAKKYQNQGLELLDLVQEGSYGLERAVDKFDPAMGYKFSTYAYWWIRQGMTRAIDNSARTIRLPIHISEKLSKMRRISKDLSQKLGRQPNRIELSKAMGIELKDLEDLVSQSAPCASLDAHARGEEDRSTLGELIPDPNYEEPMEDMDRMIQKEHLGGWLAQLNEREQKIMRLRYGLGGYQEPLTLAEIGRQINVSRERVRQLEAKALHKLRGFTNYEKAA